MRYAAFQIVFVSDNKGAVEFWALSEADCE